MRNTAFAIAIAAAFLTAGCSFHSDTRTVQPAPAATVYTPAPATTVYTPAPTTSTTVYTR